MNDTQSDKLVCEEAAELFRAGLAKLQAGEAPAAVELLERSAELEGGDGRTVARAQVARMLLVRGLLDEAVAHVSKPIPGREDMLWRLLGDMVGPLADAGRGEDAIRLLLEAAEAIPAAKDFRSAFSAVLTVYQTLRLADVVEERLLGSLRSASASRLDARLAVEQIQAIRDVERGRRERALLNLAKVAHEALVAGERRTEARALQTIVCLGDTTGGIEPALFEEEVAEPEGFLHEQPVAEQAAMLLGDAIGPVAAQLASVAAAAEEREEPGAGAALERLAAVLLYRAGRERAAEQALDHAEGLAAGLAEVVRAETLSVRAWLAGIQAEPVETEPVAREEGDEAGGESLAAATRDIRIAAAADGESESGLFIGGEPVVAADMRWPRCRGCGDALTFVAELHAPTAPLAKHARALVFGCNVAPWRNGYESHCASGAAYAGGGTLVVLDEGAPSGLPARMPPFGAPRLARRALVRVGAGTPHASDDEPLDAALAEWVGGPTGGASELDCSPRCAACGGGLKRLARLGGTRSTSVEIVDKGWLHVFCCADECSNRGVAFWQQGG